MRFLSTRLFGCATAAAAAATALGAQPATVASAPAGGPSFPSGRPVQVGDRARIRAVEREANGRRIDCEARVTAIAGDTIVVENASRWGPCPRRLYEPATLARAEFAYRSRGSRILHTAVGLAGGALAGGFAGGALADCTPWECNDEYAGIAVAFGIVLGGGAGGLIGLLLPAGARWESLNSAAPVRVAGFALRPSLRVSLR